MNTGSKAWHSHLWVMLEVFRNMTSNLSPPQELWIARSYNNAGEQPWYRPSKGIQFCIESGSSLTMRHDHFPGKHNNSLTYTHKKIHQKDHLLLYLRAVPGKSVNIPSTPAPWTNELISTVGSEKKSHAWDINSFLNRYAYTLKPNDCILATRSVEPVMKNSFVGYIESFLIATESADCLISWSEELRASPIDSSSMYMRL